jgi:hypothetical protein
MRPKFPTNDSPKSEQLRRHIDLIKRECAKEPQFVQVLARNANLSVDRARDICGVMRKAGVLDVVSLAGSRGLRVWALASDAQKVREKQEAIKRNMKLAEEARRNAAKRFKGEENSDETPEPGDFPEHRVGVKEWEPVARKVPVSVFHLGAD